jgi:hypothetical protein
MVAGRKAAPALQAVPARQEPERPFRSDVDEIRPVLLQQRCDETRTGERQAYVGVGRARDGAEAFRRDQDVVAPAAQYADDAVERIDHAIDLRVPSVGDQSQSHGSPRALGWAANSSIAAATTAERRRVWGLARPAAAVSVFGIASPVARLVSRQ